MKVIANNKKARHDYTILKTLEVGIELKGNEIKSIRAGKVNLKDSYVKITDNLEEQIINMHISTYQADKFSPLDDTRTRKLLMHKKEIVKFNNEVIQEGLSIVATKLYLDKNSRAKLEIALARGKKLHDKRHTLKERDIKRDVEKQLKFR